MKHTSGYHLVLALLWAGNALAAAGTDFEAGVAREKITPEGPFWMSGYAARTHPSEGVLQDLWAKSLALRDSQGHELVLITTDLIGIPRELSDRVFELAGKEFGLGRSNLILSCSHTHCGPAVGKNLSVLFDFNAEEEKKVHDYGIQLGDKLVALIGEARRNRAASILAFGEGNAGFAVNRRQSTNKGFVIGVSTNGPVDHAVPVLRVTSPKGQLRAVLFGYACHNTTLGGDFYRINGDYAGQAQSILEQTHPGATALFMMLCGGDQNPYPRGTTNLARQHGETLAREVERVLASDLRPVRPPILSACETISLKLATHTREQFESELLSSDKFRQRRARLMLAAYEAGNPVREVSYPVQAVRLNRDLTLLTLGGEVVVDYVLRAKREFPSANLVVAGYCNDVMCYIPSERVLKEGGYEPADSMIYYGMPGPFAEGIEGRIFEAIHRLLER